MFAHAYLAATLASCCGCGASNFAEGLPTTAGSETGPPAAASRTAKTGVLLVSHGSHSPQWRQMLLEFHDEVAPRLLAIGGIGSVKSAFMEYTEPSIATQLKAFDAEGCDNVILVPLLLTVSSHSFDDIPTIVGAKQDAKSLLVLRTERIERYVPRARVTITPLLDFSSLMHDNLLRRIGALSKNPSREGVVLVAYGDESYLDEWEDFFKHLEQFVREKIGLAAARHCWCGHLVHYSKAPTVDAIRKILSENDRAIVIPVLVARDSSFQDQIIGRAVEQVAQGERVAYVPDAILPDPKLNEWVVSTVQKTQQGLVDRNLPARERQP
jgi:hypothetical protein